ncbi:MAG TPA: ATP-binding protein [Gemmataceae bacterium]|nr:ATP-binding protein [Gemmataceae bacterium]
MSEPTLADRLQADVEQLGSELTRDPDWDRAIGVTTFDLPGSEDNTITILVPQAKLQQVPSQSLMRIKSRGDGRTYLGVVVAGPFAEPDSLRGDSPFLTTVAVRGGQYQPPFHGRVQVTILGEEQADQTLAPPRLRPLPNSLVFPLSDEEAAEVLKSSGEMRLGLVVGYEHVVAGIPSHQKSVLPRHTAVLGTTGGGKSTTIASLVYQAQAAGMSVILLDVEGEYTRLHEKTTNKAMLTALDQRKLKPDGIRADLMTLYHLVGRDSANPQHPNLRPFSLQFAWLSPYAAVEILGLTEPQQVRFMKAYEIAKEVMRELNIFPVKGDAEQERLAMEVDEFERGYPRLTLSFLMDVVAACLRAADKKKDDGEKKEFHPFNACLATPEEATALRNRIYSERMDSPVSWGALLGRLGRLNRLKVFDNNEGGARPLIYKNMLKPGTVSVIDLSDSGVSELNNIVIADLLHGVQDAQDAAYQRYDEARKKGHEGIAPSRTLIIIEEAHEFLSAERIEKMNVLFEQVARIAKRGRKRWLGLVFVTQLPQHLPRQVFGLVNSYILHKITDPLVVSTLKRTVSGIDEGLWNRVPALAPGQAVVSFPHMQRPLLLSIDPAPSELRLVD